MITKDSTLTLKPSPRKSRTKIRKPKFLSLRLQLISAAPPPPPMPTSTADHQLINLFPLHPENLVEQDKLDEDHNMAACMFSSCDDDGAATTLTGILCSGEEEEENTNNPSPSSVNYADEEGELVRTAMRRNKTERDNRHEKWVCYSEVVEKKKVMKGFANSPLTSSSSSSCNLEKDDDDRNRNRSRSKLVLKLDYEKIMKSWVNKGPLYIRGKTDPDPGQGPGLDLGMDNSQPQTVPELQDDDFFMPFSATPNGKRRDSSNGGLWTVPEMVRVENNDTTDEVGGEEALQPTTSNAKIHHREASVQRYKEKRRNRLYAKTIRYEVRKLNAEKRPRVKGRFVKRN